MRWDLEERTEDAIVSYLKTQLTEDIRVSAAWEEDQPEFPCVIVYAPTTGPVSEPAEWHDARTITVLLAIMTEDAPLLDGSGGVLSSARTRNADARSVVMGAIATIGLNALVAAQGVEGIAFSQVQSTTTERNVGDNHMVTNVTLEVIAEPVTGSGE